jgi:hypothetical protein
MRQHEPGAPRWTGAISAREPPVPWGAPGPRDGGKGVTHGEIANLPFTT